MTIAFSSTPAWPVNREAAQAALSAAYLARGASVLEAAKQPFPDDGWRPVVGECVAVVPHHPALRQSEWAHIVTRIDGSTYYCRPLGPVATRTLRNGRVETRGPNFETLQGLSTLRPIRDPGDSR